MSRLVLHRVLSSPPARSVLMLANILDLKVQINVVDILNGEHKSPEFLKLNPMGTLPTLEDGDFVLSESHAIMKYLVATYGAEHRERLYPSEPRTRAIIDQCLFFNAGVFFIALRSVTVDTFLSDSEAPTPEQKTAIDNCYSIVEAYLQTRSYIATDRLSIADLAAGTTAAALQYAHPIDADRYPKCAAWFSRLQQEKCFKDTEDSITMFGKLIRMFWEKNQKKNKENP